MTKVGEHITLDIIGTTQEYDPSVYENVIRKIANNPLVVGNKEGVLGKITKFKS